MTRGRGDRINPHNIRCLCNRFVAAPVNECTHSNGPHRRIYLDEVCELLGWGEPIEDIARRLGVELKSIDRVAYRRGTAQERAVIRRAMEGHQKRQDRAA